MTQKEIIVYRNPAFPITEFIDNYDLAGGFFSTHWHPEWEITLLLAGSALYNVNGNEYVVHSGETIYIAPEAVHCCSSLEPETLGYNICVHPSLLTDLSGRLNVPRYFLPLRTRRPEALVVSPASKSGHQIYTLLHRLYDTESHSGKDSELLLLGNLLKIWHYLMPRFPADPAVSELSDPSIKEQRLKRMLSFIHENYDKPLAVADVAGAASISTSECFRCFTECSYGSPAEYINRYRLSQAAQKLIRTNLSITDICYAAGFHSSSYFAKEFKKYYQKTPKEYRLAFNS